MSSYKLRPNDVSLFIHDWIFVIIRFYIKTKQLLKKYFKRVYDFFIALRIHIFNLSLNHSMSNALQGGEDRKLSVF